ncbi:S-layer homology domain-containing protein [Geomicrobium sp. JCM 19055]|uniref:S-layer homology domain-containing protein n=1 Tax=Geomicrobium sp. JCM 19055 TaxID=1460649 RepID=UPI0005A6C3AD|nr:S-layer homology domain-containing protein [Geomicrobium sp. JCM 19055]
MKKFLGASALVVTLLVYPSFEANASSFSDVNDSYWATEEIEYIFSKEIITGYPDSSFRPDRQVSRSQTAVMLDRALELDDVSEDRDFGDVDESHSNYDAIQRVNAAGIMTGGENDQFRPSEPLTRAQMSAVLTRAFDLEADREVEFRDLNHLHWAYDEIAPVVTNYISTGKGDGSYSPNEQVTRAQFSVFMARAINEDYRTSSTNETFYGGEWTFDGIRIGDSVEELQRLHGDPEQVLDSEYGFRWYVYHDDWDRYIQYGIEDETVVAALTPQDRWRSTNDISKGSSKTVVREQLGSRNQ